MKINLVNLISGLLLIAIALSMFYYGNIVVKNVEKDLKEHCKTCSYFDKTCPYTDQELLDQEYGNDPYCRDMGVYEMRFKFFGMFFFGVGICFLVMGVFLLFPKVANKFNTVGKRY